MDDVQKKRAYTKNRLIKELAFRAGISQHQSRAALEAIIEIAYREARANYFVLPGLCKFDVVKRAPRNVRNPMTGERLVLPEREALHVVLSKRAKETVVPRVSPMTVAEYEAMLAKKTAEEPPKLQPTAESQDTPVVDARPMLADEPQKTDVPRQEAEEFITAPEIKGDRAISFKCTTCGQEIIAPEETAGYEAECPACGAILLVPSASEPGTTYAAGGDAEKKAIVSSMEIEDLNPAQLKSRTIRIDALFDDNKPTAQPSGDAGMSEAMKSRTMRIDLPDEF